MKQTLFDFYEMFSMIEVQIKVVENATSQQLLMLIVCIRMDSVFVQLTTKQ